MDFKAESCSSSAETWEAERKKEYALAMSKNPEEAKKRKRVHQTNPTDSVRFVVCKRFKLAQCANSASLVSKGRASVYCVVYVVAGDSQHFSFYMKEWPRWA